VRQRPEAAAGQARGCVMMAFDDFKPGTLLGEREFTLSDEAVALWTGLYPDDRTSLPAMPPAMVAMVTMRAFVDILADRPRGNVHAGQKFWIARLPQLHDRMTTKLTCASKELKNNRRWLTFDSDTIDAAGHLFFRGQMTTIWTA
jgi:hypothetical protein